MEDSKTKLEGIREREQRIKDEAAKIQQEKDLIYQEMSTGCIVGAFMFRDALKTTVKEFLAVNDRFEELATLYPGYLTFLGNAENWKLGYNVSEIKYLVEYLFSSKWNKDGEFWNVVSQIADTIGISGNPFSKMG